MKIKIKRHSRSAVSVLLSICMLISCVAVGTITTFAETGYRVKGSWSENGSTWVEHNIESGWSVQLKADSTYSFVFLKSNGQQCAANTTIEGTTEYSFNNNNDASITLQTTVAGSYNFKYVSSDDGSMKVKITYPAGTATTTWTAVGDNTAIFGTAWTPSITANDLLQDGQDSHVWSKTWQRVQLASGTIKYKVAKNHKWTTSYPSSNAEKGVETAGLYNVTVTYNDSTNAVDMQLVPAQTYSLTVPNVENAVVKASYGTQSANEGDSLTKLAPGSVVTIRVTPDSGKVCTGVSGTYNTSQTVAADGSGKTWKLTMPEADVTNLTFTWGNVQPKPVYFNNGYTNYAMVSVKYTYNNETYTATMTKLANSNIWTINVPADLSEITFVGDDGANTGSLTIPWSDTTKNPPMYTAPYGYNIANGGTWGKYIPRTNEYTVSNGSSMSAKNLFTGISATLYDYYTDHEVDNGWLSIANNEYSKDGGGWKWNPYNKLNSALSDYANNTTTPKYGVSYPLYFGNLNTRDGGDSLVTGYYNWNLHANNSIGLNPSSSVVTGLAGNTLANGTIHYYKNDAPNKNGAAMAMFDEDFLSGVNTQGKKLATILRSSNFPVRKTNEGGHAKTIYLKPGTDWDKDGAWFAAYFFGGSGSSDPWARMTKVDGTDYYTCTVPDDRVGNNVIFVRMDKDKSALSFDSAWNQTGNLTLPSDDNVVYDRTKDPAKWIYDSNVAIEYVGGHTYYEYDSTDGKDNAYITSHNSTNHTAVLDYYYDNAVWSGGEGSDGNERGFFPFDYANVGSGAKDLGFGMKLEIPFTLNSGGVNSDGTAQEFRFSGDDDLWVFVDNKLVLDLGGAHVRTEGSINFKTLEATAKKAVAISTATNNDTTYTGAEKVTTFDFDNQKPNQVHTMTIYYMERGMFKSNLKFGFSFHAIPEQLQVDKKVRTYDVNSGFFIVNTTTDSNHQNDKGKNITKFEYTYQEGYGQESFAITQNGHPKDTTAGVTYSIGSNSETVNPGTTLNYNLYNDQIAYFNGQYQPGTPVSLKETIPTDSKYNYRQEFSVVDLANNEQAYNFTEGTGEHAGEYTFTPPSAHGDELQDIRLRARFTNHMLTHNLILTKSTNSPSDETDYTFQVKFDFDGSYIPYPLYISVVDADGQLVAGSSEQLTAEGKVTIKQGQSVLLEKIPEKAKIQITEDELSGSSLLYSSTTLTDAESETVSSTPVTRGVQFTMGTKDITANVLNEEAQSVLISHNLLSASTGEGYCYVTAEIKSNPTDETAEYTYPITAGVIEVTPAHIIRGSNKYLVITLQTNPKNSASFSGFYEEIGGTLKALDKTGIHYTATIYPDVMKAVVNIQIKDLFEGDDGMGKQRYTALPFYSKLDIIQTSVTITKDINNDRTDAWGDYTNYFPVQIETSADGGTTWTQVTTNLPCVDYQNGNTTNTDNCTLYGDVYVHAIRQGDKLTLSNVNYGTRVKVTELTSNPVNQTSYPTQYTNFNDKFPKALNNYNYVGVTAKTQEETPVDVAATDGAFEVRDKNLDITVTNSVKMVNLNVTKAFSDFNYDDDSTFDFTVTYKPLGANAPSYQPLTNGTKNPDNESNYLVHNAGTNVYTVKKGSNILFENIPMGSYVEVEETSFGNSTLVGGQRFVYDYAALNTAQNTHIDNGHHFAVNADDTLTVYNKVKKSEVDITKSITSPNQSDTDTVHRIKVKIQENGSSSAALTSVEYKLNKSYYANDTSTVLATTVNCDNDGFAEIAIHGQDHLYFRYPIGSYFTVEELDDSATNEYELNNITVSNAAESPAPSEAGTNPFSFQTKDANATVTITNAKVAPVQYKIKYVFPGRSYLIGEKAGQSKYGNDMAYTVTGEGRPTEVLEDGHIKLATVQENQPYEKNFMQSMTWDYNNVSYSKEGEVYTATVTATNGNLPTKTVTFYFPYESESYQIKNYNDETTVVGTIYRPKDPVPAKDDDYSRQSYTVTYQGNPLVYAKRTDAEGNEYLKMFGTYAAEKLENDETFLYWSIRAQNRNAAKFNGDYPYEEVARCYDARFSYTIFDDYRVYAVYSGDQDAPESADVSTDVYTYINFLDYSRNHWNNSDRGSANLYPNYTEGDIVWTDFDVAFENGNQLINSSSKTEVGVLIEKVGAVEENYKLRPSADDYAQNYQYYVNKYKDSAKTWKDNAIEFLKTAYISNDTYSRKIIDKKDLTNKGRCEYGYGLFVNNGTVQTEKRDSVYRAYSYIKVAGENGTYNIILCETPVYFSVQNEANM